MYTLLIDTEYILHKAVYSAMTPARREQRNWLLYPKDHEETLEAAKVIISTMLVRFKKYISNIICVTDCNSWRKRSEYKVLTSSEYKGNRDNKFDYGGYAIFRKTFKKFLEGYNIETIVCEGAEGDDILCCYTAINKRNHKNTLIFSTDHDLFQLLSYSGGSVFMTDGKSLFMPKPGTTVLEMINEDILISETKNNKLVDIKYVEPARELFIKIMHGDSSDNIKSVYTKPKETKKGTIMMTCSEKTSGEIFDTCIKRGISIEASDFDNPEKFSDDFFSVCIEAMKLQPEENLLKTIKENFIHNCKIIRLSPNNIPIDVASNIAESFHSMIKNYRPANIEKLYSDTSVSKTSESNALKGIEDTGDMSFIKG